MNLKNVANNWRLFNSFRKLTRDNDAQSATKTISPATNNRKPQQTIGVRDNRVDDDSAAKLFTSEFYLLMLLIKNFNLWWVSGFFRHVVGVAWVFDDVTSWNVFWVMIDCQSIKWWSQRVLRNFLQVCWDLKMLWRILSHRMLRRAWKI